MLSDLPEVAPLIGTRAGIQTPSNCPESQSFLEHLYPLVINCNLKQEAEPCVAGNMYCGQLSFFLTLHMLHKVDIIEKTLPESDIYNDKMVNPPRR